MRRIKTFVIYLSAVICAAPSFAQKPVAFKNFLGVNAFEWDFFEKGKNYSLQVYTPRAELIKSFGVLRQYMDWEKIESEPGHYTFNPTHKGGWNYDAVYWYCKQQGIEVLACFKNMPPWMMRAYPDKLRDKENAPRPYGSKANDPGSYQAQAKAAFQYAARYGRNKHIPKVLLSVYEKPRWTNDPPNQLKTGMDLVRYIECGNEPDKWWKGALAQQSAEEYAANLSAFYDGHQGRLGKDAGVKTADSSMKVVIGGLSVADPAYVAGIVEWCRKNRGLKPNGEVDLCFDVINYHLYHNDKNEVNQSNKSTRGVAPEKSNAQEIAKKFVELSRSSAYGRPVWVTETGYDINAKSPQRAAEIGVKSAEQTQADWILRTALLYARSGIERVDFYHLTDINPKSSQKYASSGLTREGVRRPSANLMLQAKTLLGDFSYLKSMNSDPIIDLYQHEGRRILVATLPSETGAIRRHHLNLKGVKKVRIHYLQYDTPNMKTEEKSLSKGGLDIELSETPLFIELI